MKGEYITDCDCYLGKIVPIEGIHLPTEADIFGTACTLATPPSSHLTALPTTSLSLSECYTYQGIVLGIFMLFCYLIQHYRSSIIMVFKISTAHLSVEKVFEENPLFFRYFLTRTTLLGIFLITGLLIRYAAMYELDEWLPGKIPYETDLACIVVGILATIVLFYRQILTHMVGSIIQNELFFENLRFRNRIHSCLAYLILTPLFLIVALADSIGINNMLYVIAILGGILYLIALLKSYHFFMVRDVSILQWILYLCAVEFFPISFFVLIIVRNN